MQCRCFLRIIRFYDIGILLYFIWTSSFLLSDSFFYSTIFSAIISFQQSISFHQLSLFKNQFFLNKKFLFNNHFLFLSFLYSKAVPLKAALLQQRERFFACYISIHSAMHISASMTNAVANVHLVLCGFLYKTVSFLCKHRKSVLRKDTIQIICF